MEGKFIPPPRLLPTSTERLHQFSCGLKAFDAGIHLGLDVCKLEVPSLITIQHGRENRKYGVTTLVEMYRTCDTLCNAAHFSSQQTRLKTHKTAQN